MKKIFTLLLALGTFTALFAQSDYRDNSIRYSQYGSNVYQNDKGYNGHQQNYGSYSGGRQGWNQRDQRDNHNYDQRDGNNYNDRNWQSQKDMNDRNYGGRNSRDERDQYNRDDRYNNHGNGRYDNRTQVYRRGGNLGAVAGGMIIGGILGAIISH